MSGHDSRVLKLIVRKLVQGLLMVFAVSAITFALLSTAGGDALASLGDNPQISPETIERLREVYGLDKPVTTRYFTWLSGSLRGDMGESFYFKTPVASLVLSRFKNTFLIGAAALFIAILFAAILAFLSVRFPNAKLDGFLGGLAVFTTSLPRIVLALFALAFMVWASGSAISIRSDSFGIFVIAAVVMAIPLFAIFLAQIHAGLKNAMDEPFIQLARAKGLSETSIIINHASRAALNPVLSILGISLGGIVSGSVVVETILGWPGIGSLAVAAVLGRDIALVMGVVVISSVAIWFGNSLAEVFQLLNDKRMLSGELNDV